MRPFVNAPFGTKNNNWQKTGVHMEQEKERQNKERISEKKIDKEKTGKKITNKKKINMKIMVITGALLIVAAVFASVGILILRKKININPALAGRYKVRGVDVSHYQGTIDWEKLAAQDIDFAMIKATEGSGHVDECFLENWQAAQKTDLYLGAYHFFSFDSEGHRQAAAFIETVGSLDGKFAPVIDVEYYGNKRSNPPEKAEVTENLKSMLDTLEQHYQVKPIIYTTYTVYSEYIKGVFDSYPLWVRSIQCPPGFLFGNNWSFWQYMDTAVLEGYEGGEKYIDMNVFRGTEEELEELLVQEYNQR